MRYRAKSTAHVLLTVLERLTGSPAPVRIRAWDGSEAGPFDAPLVAVRSRRAVRRLLWQPGELGLARAYVTGELDVAGDLREALRTVRGTLASRAGDGGGGESGTVPGLGDLAVLLPALTRLGALGPRPPAPAGEARPRGTPHSRGRDRAVISHHYDLTPAFYAQLLDRSMAYSCGYWTRPPGTPGYGLEQAQRDKLELVCRKVGLRPGMRLLDVGCGWGALALYAAERHTAQVTAVTLAREQAEYVRAEARERKLEDLVDVQLCDYRDISGGWYEAAVSLEMGEHVGDTEYPAFAALLHRMLRPQGRLLVQQMSRRGAVPGGGTFIESYIAPDMHMRPVGETVSLLEDAGLEVRSVEALREHYVRTVDAWAEALEKNWQQVTELVGPVTARVWRLYLAGGALAFEERRMGVDQILAVRPSERGGSGMTGTVRDWYPEGTPA